MPGSFASSSRFLNKQATLLEVVARISGSLVNVPFSTL